MNGEIGILLVALFIVLGAVFSVFNPALRRQAPIIITFIVGIMMVTAVFVPVGFIKEADDTFSLFFNILAAVAFLLGAFNLIRIHGDKISRRAPHWPYSVVTIVGFLLMLAAGLFKIGNPDGLSGSLDHKSSMFGWLYNAMFAPLQATMFSLLAFYVASASYRAFRAKTREATILLSAAFIILIGRTFLGNLLTLWLPDQLEFFKIPILANWIMTSPNMAGQRAIQIGIALGIISTSLKIILGIERSYLGSKES